jgi:outer membrane protein OmpA-like peptidoglycan-associated protein
MSVLSKNSRALFLIAALAIPASSVSAQQELDPSSSAESNAEVLTTVTGSLPADLAGMPAGPELDGVISARKGDQVQVTSADGTRTVFTVGDATQIRSTGGFLGLDKDKLGTESLLNGLPVAVRTVQWGSGLAASRVDLKSRDLKFASMIRSGTEQGFAEQTAATEALRGRVADIDNYLIKGTTNVNFEVGKANLTPEAEANLCATAQQAQATDNALLLVVGYTDSTGSQEFNQMLREKRATKVVNYLQQACGWKPYRMLTPTGMAEADPLADNETDYGKAQNRRVAVNIMVSKAVEGL